MKRIYKILVLLGIGAIAAASLSACYTMAGAGRDVQAAGDTVDGNSKAHGYTAPN